MTTLGHRKTVCKRGHVNPERNRSGACIPCSKLYDPQKCEYRVAEVKPGPKKSNTCRRGHLNPVRDKAGHCAECVRSNALAHKLNPALRMRDNAYCKSCDQKIMVCTDRLSPCPLCHESIRTCAHGRHMGSPFCVIAKATREAKSLGLVRGTDGLASMLDKTDVPYGHFPTRLDLPSTVHAEPWVPPEAIEIVQVDRPLSDRMHALRRLGAWLRENGRAPTVHRASGARRESPEPALQCL